MSRRKKIFLYLLFTILASGFLYLYIWEKPKLEALVEKYVESLSKDDTLPFKIDIGRTNFSIIPLQIELYNTKFEPKGKLSKILKNFEIEKVALRPSLLDLLIGKFWISTLKIKNSELEINIPKSIASQDEGSKPIKFDFNDVLKRVPISQISIQEFKLKVNYANQYFVTTENLYLKAYNEKSSLIVTVKDPNLAIKTSTKGESLSFLTDFQVMVTRNTISLSKIKLVKDNSYFLASGNILYDGQPQNYSELHIKTRINSNFEDLKKWSNKIYKNDHFDLLKGEIKTDIQINKGGKSKNLSAKVNGELLSLQVGKVKIGDIKLSAEIPNEKQINIKNIDAVLVGNNKVRLTDTKIHLGETIQINSDVEVVDAQLHSFLRDSSIADIPVWLNVKGQIKCVGTYKEHLNVDCPGAATISNILIKNKSRTKTIVAAKKVDIAGTIKITEKQISYTAKAKMPISHGESSGVIQFDKGFDIQYKSDHLDLSEVGKIADLKFVGTGSTKGSTKGNSDYATFEMDLDVKNFEFEDYFFGELKSKLNYKSENLYFNKINGSLESTRFNGKLQIDLSNDLIIGDIQLPFFRMADIQQAVLKKVDLKDRFLGSGSGRIRLNTPFEIDQLNFNLDARLFKGTAFGEDYNEARLQAQSIDGIIILQKAVLQKEQTKFKIKGTIDTDLMSELQFSVSQGFLQHSSLLKKYNLPISGEFAGGGRIFGKLGDPFIKTTSKIKNLIFNKKKYGNAVFSYDNSNKQTSLQFAIPEQLELLVLLPESNFKNIFVDLNANNFDVAPLLGFLVSEDATRSYVISTSGELSGNFDTTNFWNSEFSSTIKSVALDFKSNKIETTIPTNIELKNGKLFLNEISFVGNKQHIKVTQPYTEKFKTKFIINSRMNIAFFKLFAPFIEKIDGYSTLRLELTVNHKDFKLIGSSYTTDSFLKFPGFPHAFENLSADILFNQNKVLINSISGQLAGGTVTGNGEVLFPGNKKFDLQINTRMENVNINFPQGFRTSGSGAISLSGSKPPFLLSGHYDVTEGLIESNFESGGSGDSTDLLEELLKKEVTSPLLINLDITTKNSVEVRNGLVEGYILGNIKIFDKINSPRISGEAHFDDDSIIKFRDQEFEVTSSNFLFEGQSPINPRLSLRSKTRMNRYDIDLFLQGRASKPSLTWSSQPPLPETQIVSMLALGTLPDQFEQNNSSGTGDTGPSGFEIGTSMLGNNPLGKEIKERSGLEVQFSSSFGDQDSTPVPKVTVKKKITKKLQMSASSTTGSNNQLEGRVTYELNSNISTIFSIKNTPDSTTNVDSNNPSGESNPIGLDLEYKVEFD